jgi:hypothetical protein
VAGGQRVRSVRDPDVHQRVRLLRHRVGRRPGRGTGRRQPEPVQPARVRLPDQRVQLVGARDDRRLPVARVDQRELPDSRWGRAARTWSTATRWT